jgi:hypothetical protein
LRIGLDIEPRRPPGRRLSVSACFLLRDQRPGGSDVSLLPAVIDRLHERPSGFLELAGNP